MALQDMALASATQSMAMLANASVAWGETTCRAIFHRPGEMVLADMVVATDYQITFVTAQLPGLESRAAISVTPDDTAEALEFTTRAPKPGVDGYLTVMGLEE